MSGAQVRTSPATRRTKEIRRIQTSPKPLVRWHVHGPVRPSGRRKQPGCILVGTASWTDPGFIADWYPRDLPARKRLAWYAEHFNLVEVNSTFYALPSPSVARRWAQETPDGFVFDVKLHRLLSRHSTDPKLLPPKLRRLAGNGKRANLTLGLEEAVTNAFLENIQPLGEAGKLGALILQLSPEFSPRKHALEELDHLFGLLEGYKVAVELRNRNWAEGEQMAETTRFFRQHKVTLVTVDSPASEHFTVFPALDVVTNRALGYLRAHGRNAAGYVRGRSVAQRFDHQYTQKELDEIAERAQRLATLAAETHVIFNNNKSNYAPVAARQFREMVNQAARSPAGTGAGKA